ncbi:MAG: helix-turn-helix transcriptional regulator [Verrucomicrobia bacterium]|nr:helix-turn-helix transcriptional regulator [Verrucomicrobiota bacterium]
MKIPKRFLRLADLQPQVDLAGCYRFPERIWFDCRNPTHGFKLMESGVLEVRTVDGAFSAGPGDLVYLRPAPRSQVGVTAGTVFYQTAVALAPPPRGRRSLWLDPVGPLPGRIAMGEHFEEMRAVFESLILELDKEGDLHKLRTVAAVHQMLALIVQVASGAGRESTRLDPWQRARLRLEQDMSQEIRVDALARELGFSADYFIRQFKARFGLSPMEYRTRVRLREAVRLLRGTDLAVKQIAHRLGWRDAGLLAGHCRHVLGRSPTDIRSGQSAADLALPGEKLYPVNLHVVPPGAGPDWFKQWMMPDRPWDVFTKATALKLSAKRPVTV